MNESVNTASIGDNKTQTEVFYAWDEGFDVDKVFNMRSDTYVRNGHSQTLCAECRAPTPLNDMFPTGPDNVFKCWSCAQIPVLADITD